MFDSLRAITLYCERGSLGMATLASRAAKKGWRKGRGTRELIRERDKKEECRLQFEEFAGPDGLGMCLDMAFFAGVENPYTDPETHLAYRIWLTSRSAMGKTAQEGK